MKNLLDNFKIPLLVKKVMDDREISNRGKWISLVEIYLEQDKLHKPSLPCVLGFGNCFKNLTDGMKEVKKIYQNWVYIQEVAANYDLLIDFITEYKGDLRSKAIEKASEYKQFLKEKMSHKEDHINIFDSKEKFNWGVAEQVYFSEFREDFKKLKVLKGGNNKKKSGLSY